MYVVEQFPVQRQNEAALLHSSTLTLLTVKDPEKKYIVQKIPTSHMALAKLSFTKRTKQ